MKDPRKQIVAHGYDRLAADYLAWSSGLEGDPRHRMLALFAEKLPTDARVLELGCGAGVPSTRALASRFRVIGVDISAAQLRLARQNVPDAEFIGADFTELAFPEESFHGVAALYSVSHVPREQHAQLFADVFRWLIPGGWFMATLGAADSPDWTGEWLGGPMFFSSHGADANRVLLRDAGFDLVVDEILETHEPEGVVRFLWVIAQKPAER